MTQGNLKKQYIGITDQPLCPDGLAQAQALARTRPLPPCDVVFSSPLLRCRQTAEVLFPDQAYRIARGLAECDFGRFECKSPDDLASDTEYKQWVDSDCEDPIPGGEDVTVFRERTVEAFAREVSALPENITAAFVIHGGVIMSILERYAVPKRAFYEYYLGNCQYYSCRFEGESLVITEWPAT